MQHSKWLFAGLVSLVALGVTDRSSHAVSPRADAEVKTTAQPTVDPAVEKQDAFGAAKSELPWLSELASGYVEAQRQCRPILVRVGGVWCPHCTVLEEQLKQKEVQSELERWTLVYIDVDLSVEDARAMGVGPIPALRLLTSTGKVVVAHDGAMEADELVKWLQANYDKAVAAPSDELVSSETPNTLSVVRLIREFSHRDATLREGAVRRLLPYPHIAAVPVSDAFAGGSLSTRLAALDLLSAWKAPVEGLDPWRPETITPERLKVITEWAVTTGQSTAAKTTVEEVAPLDISDAADSIERMLAATPAEAQAIRERLARYRQSLLPAVYERLKIAETDVERERLTSLRYRLLASDELALTWPGGLERLAAIDLETRKRAASELASRATSDDEALLLELFTDPAPLVREIALNALQSIGGGGLSDAMLRLLKDPEPNVRAAVLKQLAESPTESIVPSVADYITGETDSDLVVHAVRVLRAAKGEAALDSLKGLLTHPTWQVRAEAAEAIGEIASQDNELDEALKAGAFQSLVHRLEDEDGFVVSRAVKSLSDADLVSVVEPLAKAIARHPNLAKEIIEALTTGQKQRAASIPHLRELCKSADARVRAAALKGLCTVADENVEAELSQGLKDEQSMVRIAAAEALLTLAVAKDDRAAIDATGEAMEAASPETGFLGAVKELLLGPASDNQPEVDVQVVEEVPPEELEEPKRDAAKVIAEFRDPASDARPENARPDEPAADESSSDVENIDRSEEFLVRIRKGEVFDKWIYDLAPSLEGMLKADLPDERLAAGLSLAALGQDAQAKTALNGLLDEQPALADKIAPALRWLKRDDRRQLFERLVAVHTGKDQLSKITTELAAARDVQSADALWELLFRDNADARLAEAISVGLKQLYFDENSYNPEEATASQRRRASADATPRAKSGPAWQRIAALSILIKIEATLCEEIAQQMAADPQLAPEVQVSAFKILLVSQAESTARQTAVQSLESGNDRIRRTALATLALGGKAHLDSTGKDTFSLAESYTFLDFGGDFSVSLNTDSTENRLILPEPPEGLTVDKLQPFSETTDSAAAAYASYLLVLLDQPEAIGKLISHWEQTDPKDEQWRRLVYRAIAYQDDPAYVPVLERIYKSLGKSDDGLKEFYWTVRSMTVPEVLSLRKRIRDDAGMERLE